MIVKSSASTGVNSPASWPASTMERMASRHRSSDFSRTAATPAFRGDSAHRSSQSSQYLFGSGSVPGRQFMPISSASRPAASGMFSIRRRYSAYQVSSEYLMASVSSWSRVLK